MLPSNSFPWLTMMVEILAKAFLFVGTEEILADIKGKGGDSGVGGELEFGNLKS